MFEYSKRDKWFSQFERSQPNRKILTGKHNDLTLSDVRFRAEQNIRDKSLHTGWQMNEDFAGLLGFHKRKKSREVFNSIIVDLVLCVSRNCGVSYHRSGAYYNRPNTGILGYVTVINAIDYLVEKGLVISFVAPAGTKVPQTSFMYASDDLLMKCPQEVVCNGLREHPKSKSVQYKDRVTKRNLRPLQTDFSINTEKELYLQNEFLNSFKYGLEDKKGSLVTYTSPKGNFRSINFLQVSQSRSFLIKNADYDNPLGGRYYGGFWQGLSKEIRAKITINDEIVGEELDFKCLHLQLAYAFIGKELDKVEAGYDIPLKHLSIGQKLPLMTLDSKAIRKIAKNAVLISLNARNQSAAKGALLEEIEAMFPTLLDDYFPADKSAFMKAIIEEVMKHHSEIFECFKKDYGVKFQFFDSEIMTEIQKRCREKGIPVLGVHDSVLYPHSHAEFVKQTFYQVLETYLKNIRLQSMSKSKIFQE